MEQPNDSGSAGKYIGQHSKLMDRLARDPLELAKFRQKRQKYNADHYARRMADPVKKEQWRRTSREAMQKQSDNEKLKNLNDGV